MAKWVVVLNPAAGRKSTAPEEVRSALRAAGVEARVEVPASPAETAAVIEDAVRAGSQHFALAGGDGTVNLAANTLLRHDWAEPPVVAVLPIGTGCDLLRTFGLPQDLGGAAQHLATDSTYDIDVATVEGEWGLRYFVNVAQIGVGAAAAETAAHYPRALGASRYPVGFLARLPRFPPTRVTVETERRTYESEALALIMANAQFFAGGWNVAPKATLVDGVLDMQIINCSKSRAPSLVPKIIRGTHLTDRAVKRFRAATFKVETDIPWPLEADGDFIGNTPLTGRVVPAALRLKI